MSNEVKEERDKKLKKLLEGVTHLEFEQCYLMMGTLLSDLLKLEKSGTLIMTAEIRKRIAETETVARLVGSSYILKLLEENRHKLEDPTIVPKLREVFETHLFKIDNGD